MLGDIQTHGSLVLRYAKRRKRSNQPAGAEKSEHADLCQRQQLVQKQGGQGDGVVDRFDCLEK